MYIINIVLITDQLYVYQHISKILYKYIYIINILIITKTLIINKNQYGFILKIVIQ